MVAKDFIKILILYSFLTKMLKFAPVLKGLKGFGVARFYCTSNQNVKNTYKLQKHQLEYILFVARYYIKFACSRKNIP